MFLNFDTNPTTDTRGVFLDISKAFDNHKAIQCDYCNTWVHLKCNNLSAPDYELLISSAEPWFCLSCNTSILPFGNLNNEQLLINNKDININFEASNLNLIPPKDIQKLFKEINNLSSKNDSANEFHINCQYYDIEAFEKSKFKSNDYFSILHINIASLSKHKHDISKF